MEVRRGAFARPFATVTLVVTATVLATLIAAAPAPADSGSYAPLDHPGPPLSVPASQLSAALSCTAGIADDARDPILLVPGTDLDPGPNYSWNYERAFAALHWAYCTITLPAQTTGDIQVAGEYIVYALRTMAHLSRRQVDVLGYSQGGMLPRWALRFWPDTRPLVHDMVGIDPSNHGTLDANAICQQPCSAADWQQAAGSHFIDALNSYAETFPGIYYTVIYSHTDEIVVPNFNSSGSSSLHTGGGTIANIAVQQICPADVSDHLAMGSYDPVAYALVVDAFTHPGTADPARISPTVCTEPFQPAVDPSSFPSDYAAYLQDIAQGEVDAQELPAEPPLACYVFASCPTAASTHATKPHKRATHKRATRKRATRKRASHKRRHAARRHSRRR